MTIDAPLVLRLLNNEFTAARRRMNREFDQRCIEMAKLYELPEYAAPLFKEKDAA